MQHNISYPPYQRSKRELYPIEGNFSMNYLRFVESIEEIRSDSAKINKTLQVDGKSILR